MAMGSRGAQYSLRLHKHFRLRGGGPEDTPSAAPVACHRSCPIQGRYQGAAGRCYTLSLACPCEPPPLVPSPVPRRSAPLLHLRSTPEQQHAASRRPAPACCRRHCRRQCGQAPGSASLEGASARRGAAGVPAAATATAATTAAAAAAVATRGIASSGYRGAMPSLAGSPRPPWLCEALASIVGGPSLHGPSPKTHCNPSHAQALPAVPFPSPALESFAADLSAAPGPQERSRLLLGYARRLPAMPEGARTDANRVMGCTAQVRPWGDGAASVDDVSRRSGRG